MHRSIGWSVLLDEGHDLRIELVGPFGAARFGQQPRYALAQERRFGLVERRARHAEQDGGLYLRGPIDTEVAQHLVLGLDQIAGIEELARLEQRCVYAFGMRIENTL